MWDTYPSFEDRSDLLVQPEVGLKLVAVNQLQASTRQSTESVDHETATQTRNDPAYPIGFAYLHDALPAPAFNKEGIGEARRRAVATSRTTLGDVPVDWDVAGRDRA